MSDEPKPNTPSEATEPEPKSAETERGEYRKSAHDDETPTDAAPAKGLNSTTILVAIAVALLAAILAINLTGQAGKNSNTVTELAKKKVERDALRASINAERARLGLPPLEGLGSTEDPSQIAARLGKDAATLATMLTKFDDVIRERDSQIAQKTRELLSSEQQRQALAASVARLQQQLDKALAESGSVSLLRSQLKAATTRAADLETQLNEVKAKLAQYANRPPSEALQTLKRQLEEARRARDFYDEQNRKLEAELAKLRSSQAVPPPPKPHKLFAETEADLLPAAVKLFARLRQLEGVNDSAVMAEYAKLGKELGATVLRRVYFPTGKSELTPEEKKVVDDLAPNLPNRGLILVIGYASRTGNVDNNRKLSSARATRVAEEINTHKLAGQQVQAAYLGQTNRFSGRVPEKNQICEIWHILPPGN